MNSKSNFRKWRTLVSSAIVLVLFLYACSGDTGSGTSSDSTASGTVSTDTTVVGESVAELTAPPFVPEPIGNRPPTKLIVNLEVIEKEGYLADSTKYLFWTFGGTVPGSFIRTRVGDVVEFHLKSHPDNMVAHNIDLHAVTGQGGGAASSTVSPGYETVFTFKLINQGLYVYHCATAPVGMHIANGMYGLILVEPAGGLPPVDKEYYVMQGDFYTTGKNGAKGLQAFDMDKAIMEHPDYVVFNGKSNQLTGDNALTAEVGETVRIFFGVGGPNITSSFHVIGEIFDKVYVEGGDLVNTNVQTTMVPSGGSAIVEFKCEVPATYILVDHSLFRTFHKGTIGMLKVTGAENKTIFGGKQGESSAYNP